MKKISIIIALLVIMTTYLGYKVAVNRESTYTLPKDGNIPKQSKTIQEKQDTNATIKYLNEELGFSAQLPVESKLEDINVGDTENGAVLHINYPSFKMSIFVLNRQFTDSCSKSTTDKKIMNGIQFFVHDASGEFSSQESRAVARSYCVENGALQYVITPFISYALYSGGYSVNNPNPGPDKSYSFELFDQAVSDLDFHFL